MEPGPYDITIYRGVTWSRTLQWKRNGVVQPLDGYTGAKAILRPHGEDPIEIAGTIDTGTDKTTITFDDSVNALWEWDDGIWSFRLHDADDQGPVLLRGSVRVLDA